MSGAGALRHRLTLQTLERAGDGGGGFAESWRDVACVWAGVKAVGGDEQVRGGRLSGNASHVITLRYRDDVSPQMRFCGDGTVFEVSASYDADGKRQWLTCLCEMRDL